MKKEYILTEDFVQKRIEKYLNDKGWNHNLKTKTLNEHGCDIVVSDGNNKNKARRYFIECKGRSYASSAKAISDTNMLFALGQLVTRMKVIAKHAYKYGLGLPEESAKIALRRIPWQVARALTLNILSVDSFGNVKEYSPSDFKKFQKELSIKDLIKILKTKNEYPPLLVSFTKELEKTNRKSKNDFNPWYKSQKEHILGWLEEYNTPGFYDRKNLNKTAKQMFNGINNPMMIFWLCEVADIEKSKLIEAKTNALKAKNSYPSMCSAIRKVITWEDVNFNI